MTTTPNEPSRRSQRRSYSRGDHRARAHESAHAGEGVVEPSRIPEHPLVPRGAGALVDTEQSMGGEDFAWYLDDVPGALARLGVRPPGGAAFDLHQGTFDIDESALDVGVRYTVALAEAALSG